MTRSLRLHHYVLEIILLILCGVLAFTAPGFLTAENLLNGGERVPDEDRVFSRPLDALADELEDSLTDLED